MDRRFRIGPPMDGSGCIGCLVAVVVLGLVFALEVLPRLSPIWMTIHGK